MRVVRDEERELESWRDGVDTLMYCSAALGAHQLTVFEQWCTSGNGAPLHRHAVEELLRILSGEAEVQVGDDRELLADGASVIIPAGTNHAFRNIGDGALHVLAILAEPVFEAHYVDPPRDVRRWEPE